MQTEKSDFELWRSIRANLRRLTRFMILESAFASILLITFGLKRIVFNTQNIEDSPGRLSELSG